MKRVAYTYCTIRYVHDSVSGESLNVAVVLLDSEGRMEFKLPNSLTRVKRAFPDANVAGLRLALISLEHNCRTFLASNPMANLLDVFEWSLPVDESNFKRSNIGAGLTQSLSKTADELLERFVLRCDVEFNDVEIVESYGPRFIWGKKATLSVPMPGNDDWHDTPQLACIR